MTGARSDRSAGLFVGSTPSIMVKVQSAGQTFSRLFANRRCQRLRAFLGEASSSSVVVRSGPARSRLGGDRGRDARAGRRARSQTRGRSAQGHAPRRFLRTQAVGVTTEIALKVRPAHLSASRVAMAVPVRTIGHNDAGIRPDERVELLSVAVLSDLQEHRLPGGRGPQRASIAPWAPAGLINMRRRRVQHGVVGAGTGRPTPRRCAGRSHRPRRSTGSRRTDHAPAQ